jgi:hypothetical protein
MSTSTRILGLIPLVALAALTAAGSFAVASPKLDGTLEQAKEMALDAVHQGASAIAQRTGSPQAAERRVRGERPIPRTGPPPRSEPPPPPPKRATIPTRELGGQVVPDFAAVQDGAKERLHSGRQPPR